MPDPSPMPTVGRRRKLEEAQQGSRWSAVADPHSLELLQ